MGGQLQQDCVLTRETDTRGQRRQSCTAAASSQRAKMHGHLQRPGGLEGFSPEPQRAHGPANTLLLESWPLECHPNPPGEQWRRWRLGGQVQFSLRAFGLATKPDGTGKWASWPCALPMLPKRERPDLRGERGARPTAHTRRSPASPPALCCSSGSSPFPGSRIPRRTGSHRPLGAAGRVPRAGSSSSPPCQPSCPPPSHARLAAPAERTGPIRAWCTHTGAQTDTPLRHTTYRRAHTRTHSGTHPPLHLPEAPAQDTRAPRFPQLPIQPGLCNRLEHL